MRTFRYRPLVGTLATAVGIGWLAGAGIARAEEGPPGGGTAHRTLVFDEGSTLRLDGDSTLHKYHLQTSTLSGAVELGAPPAGDAPGELLAGQIKSLEVAIPLASLASGDKGLDENARKALKAAAHPNAVLHFTGVEVAPAGEGTRSVKLTGTLSVAGTRKPLVLEAQAQEKGGQLHVTGTKTLKMSEHGVSPPVIMLVIRTFDPITVKVDLRIKALQPVSDR